MQQLQHYALVMRRWLLLMVLGVLICSIVTFAVNKYMIKPVYDATSLIQVNGSLTPTNTSSGSDVFSDQALAVSDSLLVTSTDVLQAVTKEIPGVSLTQLKTMVNASPQAGSQIIEVRASAGSPQLAANIANMVVSVFIQQQVDKVMGPLKSQDAQISQDVLTTKTAMEQAQAQVSNLQTSNATAEALANANKILITYQTNYNSLLTNQQQIQSQENQTRNALSVAQSALLPDQASSPRILVNTGIAAALGLLLVIVLALLLDWLDTTIQTPEDVVKLAQLEPLGSVPLSDSPLLVARAINSSAVGDYRIAQAFTAMVIGTNFSTLHTGKHAILVTGFHKDAGVTTTATNLAISLSRLGKQVLLVDANMHQPSLHEIFYCDNTNKGFANGLIDGDQFNNRAKSPQISLSRTSIPNLRLLPAGSTATAPSIAEHLQALQRLTDWALGKNQLMPATNLPDMIDIIIFDAPAMGENADAIALASVADWSILVVDAGKERSEMVSKAGAMLQRLGSPVLGVVVNRQTAKHRPYFYTDNRQQKAVSSLEEAMEILLAKQAVSSNPSRPLNQVSELPKPMQQSVFTDMTLPLEAVSLQPRNQDVAIRTSEPDNRKSGRPA